jgi:hypothetical protein
MSRTAAILAVIGLALLLAAPWPSAALTTADALLLNGFTALVAACFLALKAADA